MRCKHDAICWRKESPTRTETSDWWYFGIWTMRLRHPFSHAMHADLRHVVAAHLSEQNNHPHLACTALTKAMIWPADAIVVATQNGGFSWHPV